MKLNWNELHTKSNYLSIFRIFLGIPIFVYTGKFAENPELRFLLFGLFFLAYITDILDGYLARKFNEITEFGKIVDPLADKVIIAIVVIQFYLTDVIPEYYFWIIILRDVIIFLGGIYVSNKIGKVLPSNKLGKATVFTIMLFFLAVIFNRDLNSAFVYDSLLYLSTIMCFISVLVYAYRGYESIKWKKNETIQKS
ncbi:MAG: CDP-alcohol phosphatidyltransferase family protein [Melioribacteraceae bacterium]|nr:CDP-alcohol phosphatidyltransferase family protein [Melioribacteraceae bacterium]